MEAAQQAAASPEPGGVPAEFIARCLSGLRGTPDDKAATFGYFASLNEADAGLRALISVAQTAFFLPDPAQADASSLSGVYADTWAQILGQFKRGASSDGE